MPWSWSPIRRASLGALLAVASLAPAALAGDGSPTVYRTAPSGTSALLEDISANEFWAYAGWVERSGSSVESRFVATNTAAAIDFVDLTGSSTPRIDLCSEFVGPVAVTTYESVGGDRALWLQTEGGSRQIEETGTDYRRADIACYDDSRAALVVNRSHGGKTRLILWTFKVADLTDAESTGWNLGPVDKGVSPAIAAGGGYLQVVWRTGTSIKAKRFKIGAGHTLTPKPTVTIETTTGQDAPRIAADGKRVVIAWQRKRDVVVRVSTDKGATFGARHTALSAGSAISGKVGFLNSVDVLGSTMVVGGAVVTDVSGTGRVVRSSDNGKTWKTVAGTAIAGAFVFGALGGSAASPRLRIALDHRTVDPDPATIDLGWVDLP